MNTLSEPKIIGIRWRLTRDWDGANPDGYEVWEEDEDGQKRGWAMCGNHPSVSDEFIDPAETWAVPTARLIEFAEHTAGMWAAELGLTSADISREDDDQ